MKIILLFLAFITLSSCVNTAKVLDSYIGKTENELVQAWGIPTRTYELNSFTKLIEYKRLTGIYGTNHCTRTFTVKRGVVTYWKQTGLGC